MPAADREKEIIPRVSDGDFVRKPQFGVVETEQSASFDFLRLQNPAAPDLDNPADSNNDTARPNLPEGMADTDGTDGEGGHDETLITIALRQAAETVLDIRPDKWDEFMRSDQYELVSLAARVDHLVGSNQQFIDALVHDGDDPTQPHVADKLAWRKKPADMGGGEVIADRLSVVYEAVVGLRDYMHMMRTVIANGGGYGAISTRDKSYYQRVVEVVDGHDSRITSEVSVRGASQIAARVVTKFKEQGLTQQQQRVLSELLFVSQLNPAAAIDLVSTPEIIDTLYRAGFDEELILYLLGITSEVDAFNRMELDFAMRATEPRALLFNPENTTDTYWGTLLTLIPREDSDEIIAATRFMARREFKEIRFQHKLKREDLQTILEWISVFDRDESAFRRRFLHLTPTQFRTVKGLVGKVRRRQHFFLETRAGELLVNFEPTSSEDDQLVFIAATMRHWATAHNKTCLRNAKKTPIDIAAFMRGLAIQSVLSGFEIPLRLDDSKHDNRQHLLDILEIARRDLPIQFNLLPEYPEASKALERAYDEILMVLQKGDDVSIEELESGFGSLQRSKRVVSNLYDDLYEPFMGWDHSYYRYRVDKTLVRGR